MDEGLPKLWLTRQGLHLRRRRPELFGRDSTYRPLPVHGPGAEHVLAFTRREQVVTIVPRLVLGFNGGWEETTVELPAGRFRNVLNGEEVDGGERPVAALLARFPVALLESL
jgi:(1->4)-alpha-D-glucan 1-alpha-D-glucosylmutase